jgi:hypothetical protein
MVDSLKSEGRWFESSSGRFVFHNIFKREVYRADMSNNEKPENRSLVPFVITPSPDKVAYEIPVSQMRAEHIEKAVKVIHKQFESCLEYAKQFQVCEYYMGSLFSRGSLFSLSEVQLDIARRDLVAVLQRVYEKMTAQTLPGH